MHDLKIATGLLSASLLFASTWGMAQSSPPQIHPVYPEVGITWTPSDGSSSGMNTGSAGNTASSNSTASGGSSLSKMMSQEWGQQAASNAETMGVNADALAATCVMESGCTNITSTHGSITGAFQMTQSTYNAMIREALVDNPQLQLTQEQINNGQNDPAVQAIAAAQYMKDGATYLQNKGISNPTALDTRAYYNFGPADGYNIASAKDSDLMSDVLIHTSATTQAANGISSSMTVGQWKASVAKKMGSSANTPVLKQ